MPAWDQIAVGVAAVMGLIYVARTLRRVNRDVLDFLGNHLTDSVRAQQNVARALRNVANRLEAVEDAVRHNDD